MIGFSQLLGRMKAPSSGRSTCRILPLDAHNGPVYAVGDVHGCKTHLHGLINMIRQDAKNLVGTAEIVLLGDVVDRGPDSAGVLDFLTNQQYAKPVRSILGNHERMMQAFFAAPKRNLAWLEQGGFETLRSYGLSLMPQVAADMPLRRLMQMLDAHVPQAHLDWIASLPHGYRFHLNAEDFVLVHAGYDLSLPDNAQQEEVVIWGRQPASNSNPDAFGIRCVQGHKIVRTPDPTRQRIQIDTGAWRTGKLSALCLVSGCSPRLVCYSE
jgi:serine/threonine protein phosphatase 1